MAISSNSAVFRSCVISVAPPVRPPPPEKAGGDTVKVAINKKIAARLNSVFLLDVLPYVNRELVVFTLGYTLLVQKRPNIHDGITLIQGFLYLFHIFQENNFPAAQ